MQLADFLIGQPGPGCVSEALAMNLPVIVKSNAGPFHKSASTPRGFARPGTGMVVDNFKRLARSSPKMLERRPRGDFANGHSRK